RASAAAIVAEAVLGVVGIVGMARPVRLGDFGVILGTVVDVLDHQADRRAGGLAFERAREDADLVRLLALGGEFAGPGAPCIEERLDMALIQLQPRRAPVHDGAERGPMALAPGRVAEGSAEGVPAHARAIRRYGE